MDRGLLLALTALQNNFITHDQFLIGFETWVSDRSTGLHEILVARSFLSRRQLESLVSNLVSILEQSNNNWRMGIAGNTVARGVYEAMLTLAKNDAIALNWVEWVGEELGIETSRKKTERPKSVDLDDDDPYGTFDFDELPGPYATLSNDEKDESK